MVWTPITKPDAVDTIYVERSNFGYPVVDNLNDLNTRTTAVEGVTADANTGNTALGNRLGAGVGTGSNVVTGSATSQLTDLRTRATASETNLGTWSGGTAISRIQTLETRTTDVSGVVGIGNQRLSDRLGAGVTTSATAASRLTVLETVMLLRKSADQSVPTGTDTIVTWNTVDEDTASYRSGNTAIVPAGVYQFHIQTRFKGNASGTERVSYLVDYTSGNLTAIETKVRGGLTQAPVASGAANILAYSPMVKVTSTTTFVIVVFQNSGSSIDLAASEFGGSFFGIRRIK